MAKKEARTQESIHDEIEALLPWHATGRLDATETDRVERHLEDSDRCRVAFDGVQQIQSAVADEPIDWTPDPGAFDRLRAQIAIEAPRTAEQPTDSARRGWQRLVEWLVGETPLPRWAVAAPAALAAVLAFLVASPQSEPDPTIYRTLTGASAQSAASGTAIQIAFDHDATEARIRALLQETKVRLVDGPSSIGFYGLALAPGADIDATLVQLRASSIVTFAEPVSAKTVGDVDAR